MNLSSARVRDTEPKQMHSKYIEDGIVSCYMSDCHHLLRPESFLDLAQQLAVKAAQVQSFSDSALKKFNCAWVLARMRTRFEKSVRFDENIRLETWHKGLSGLYFLRDYRLLDSRGEVAVNSTSSWIVMNLDSRHICRDEEVLSLIPQEPQSPDSAIEEPCPRLAFPHGAELNRIGTHRVAWSDVDYNGHANNVKYTVWALDNLPPELVFGHSLSEVSINFNKEVRAGDTVTLYHAEADGAHMVEGRSGDHQVFIEKLVFEP